MPAEIIFKNPAPAPVCVSSRPNILAFCSKAPPLAPSPALPYYSLPLYIYIYSIKAPPELCAAVCVCVCVCVLMSVCVAKIAAGSSRIKRKFNKKPFPKIFLLARKNCGHVGSCRHLQPMYSFCWSYTICLCVMRNC